MVGRMEKYILNGGAQDEAEPKPFPSLASLLVTGRMKCFIFLSAVSDLLRSHAWAENHAAIRDIHVFY
jgi:hypothetical protein